MVAVEKSFWKSIANWEDINKMYVRHCWQFERIVTYNAKTTFRNSRSVQLSSNAETIFQARREGDLNLMFWYERASVRTGSVRRIAFLTRTTTHTPFNRFGSRTNDTYPILLAYASGILQVTRPGQSQCTHFEVPVREHVCQAKRVIILL